MKIMQVEKNLEVSLKERFLKLIQIRKDKHLK